MCDVVCIEWALESKLYKNQEQGISECVGWQRFVRCGSLITIFFCAEKEGLFFIHSFQIIHHDYRGNEVPTDIYSCINSVSLINLICNIDQKQATFKVLVDPFLPRLVSNSLVSNHEAEKAVERQTYF